METSQPSSSDPSAAAGDYPRWVIFADQKLNRHSAGLCPSPADARTVAHARTSIGLSVRASFRFAAPPAVSRLYLDFDHGLPDEVDIFLSVVVAHADSVLIHMNLYNKEYEIDTTDYFVYNAGDSARPPSLSLLPPCYGERSYGRRYQVTMTRKCTGILRRLDGELVVATDWKMNIIACDEDDHGGAKRVEAEIRVLLSSEWQWKVRRLPVRHEVNKGEVISYCWWRVWETDWIIPVGDRFFYCVDLHQGIVFSDVCEESPELRFVPLPVEPILRGRKDWDMPESCRSVCATDGGATVKFVHVYPRCCCRGPGATKCELSRHAFAVTTWTLKTTTQGGDMGWEIDAVVDCDHFWALDAYRLLPRLPMDFPVVSIDDPDVACLLVSEHKHLHHNGDKTTWVVMVDTRTKALLRSDILYSNDKYYLGESLLPSQVSSYFNASPGPGSTNHSAPPESRRRFREDIVGVSPAANCPIPSPDEEILAALQEIPGLTRDEMLRAYGVLACDDRRRYRSLVALPMNMRKDYCSMLVDMGTNKCSSCSARLAAATGALSSMTVNSYINSSS